MGLHRALSEGARPLLCLGARAALVVLLAARDVLPYFAVVALLAMLAMLAMVEMPATLALFRACIVSGRWRFSFVHEVSVLFLRRNCP